LRVKYSFDLERVTCLAITADTYTSVLPEVAHQAANAIAAVIPRSPSREP